MESKLSNHGAKRMKERCGASKKAAKRMGNLALERGIPIDKAKGPLRKWLDAKLTCDDRQIMAWGDKAYIFSEQLVLITVLQIPQQICKNMKNMVVREA